MLSRPGRCHSSSLLLGPRLAGAPTPSQHACHNRGTPVEWTRASCDQGRPVTADPARATCAYGSVPVTSLPPAPAGAAAITDNVWPEPRNRTDSDGPTPLGGKGRGPWAGRSAQWNG